MLLVWYFVVALLHTSVHPLPPGTVETVSGGVRKGKITQVTEEADPWGETAV